MKMETKQQTVRLKPRPRTAKPTQNSQWIWPRRNKAHLNPKVMRMFVLVGNYNLGYTFLITVRISKYLNLFKACTFWKISWSIDCLWIDGFLETNGRYFCQCEGLCGCGTVSYFMWLLLLPTHWVSGKVMFSVCSQGRGVHPMDLGGSPPPPPPDLGPDRPPPHITRPETRQPPNWYDIWWTDLELVGVPPSPYQCCVTGVA